MSAPDVTQRINDLVRLEIRDALYEAKRPLGVQVIADACETAADSDDVQRVLHAMVADGELRAVTRGGVACYCQSSTSSAPKKRPEPTDIAADEDKTTTGPRPNGLLARCVDAIKDAGKPLAGADIAACIGDDDEQRISSNLYHAARDGRRVAVIKRIGRTPLYGLIEWAESASKSTDQPDPESAEQPIAEPSYHAADRPANDAPATTGHRFGLWSDGTLAIETDAGDVDLPPAVTHDLIAYLIRERAQVAHLFDTELEARDA